MLRTFLLAVVCCIHLSVGQADKQSVLKWTESVREALDKWAKSGMNDTVLSKTLDPISESFPADVSYQFARNGKSTNLGIGYEAIKAFTNKLRAIHKIRAVLPGEPDPAFDLAAWNIVSADDGETYELLISAKFDHDKLYSYNLFYNW